MSSDNPVHGESKEDTGDKKEEEVAIGEYEQYICSCQRKSKDEVADKYGTNLITGLTEHLVQEAREKYGYNELTPSYEHPWWVKLLISIFEGFFNMLLWVGSLLCFIAYGVVPDDPSNLYLGITLAVVVTITGVFGYYQESKSSDIMASFSTFQPKDTVVWRDGNVHEIEARDLVPGDLIKIKAGDKIAADIRIVNCSDMKVNNSSLTGESDSKKRAWVPSNREPLEAPNMAFFGTLCVKGNGKGIVVATGDHTFMGTVALMAQETENVETPIAIEIKDFVFKVSGIAMFLGVLFFILGMLKNPDPVKNLVFLIGIIVANVPEGLLATVTVCLTLTANRMGVKNVQVKNLESVETLGSTSVICSDKTGTLTTSVMTVSNIYYDRKVVCCDTHNPYTATTEREIGSFYLKDNSYQPSMARLLRIGVLCNNAVESQSKDRHGNPKIQGDGTEVAIFKFCSGHLKRNNPNNSTYLYRSRHPKLYEIPFDSANKWQISIHRKTKGIYQVRKDEKKEDYNYRALAVLKGAPERVLNMCSHILYKGVVSRKLEADTKKILEDVYNLAKQGERVLAFADMELCPEEYNVEREEPILELHEAPEDLKRPIEEDGIWIKLDDTFHVVELKEKDKNGRIMAVEEHTFGLLYECAAAVIGVKAGELRINHGSSTDELDKNVRLRELGYGKGTVFHATIGPYKFEGTSRETANYPFGRDQDSRGLTFVGLYSMIDPARAGVPEAVAKCQDAGIKVIMVTGDYPVTAHAIAKNVNIIGKDDEGNYHMTKQEVAELEYGSESDIDRVDKNHKLYKAALIPGKMLADYERRSVKNPQLIEDFWNEILTKKSIVFARASPQQKLVIVQACQLRGGVVAVTGDGVNDSPALKKADIGIAMGITGTDVAKESADMILKDDNFASIVNGIEEGRLIFDNLKKSIAYTLSSNIPEIAPFLVYQVGGVPLPLPTVMILLVDLGTDLAPAISMAHEGAEADIMLKSPRDQNVDKLVTWNLVSFSYLQIGVLQALAGFYAFFVVLWNYGINPADTIAMDDNNLYAYTPGKYAPQRDGYWMWCFDEATLIAENKDRSCIYGPDPSAFSCYFDEYTFSQDGGLGETGDCIAPADVTSEHARNVYQFVDWYVASAGYIARFRNTVAKIILLEAAPPQSSCGDNSATTTSDMSLFTCGSSCFDDSGCLAFKFDGECQHFATCEEEEKDTSGSYWRVDFAAEGRIDSYREQFSAWIDSSTTERKLFGIYTETLYTLFNKDGYLKQAKPYSRRTCYGISEQVGAKYTRAYRNVDIGVNCDEFNTTGTWEYWNPDNEACSTLNNCYNVDKDDELSVTTTGPMAGGKTGQTRPGVNSIYPIDQNTRRRALAEGNTAYFISIIIVQWADLMICKTRTRSLFEQTMTNGFMNYALFFETVLGACLVYLPLLNLMMGTAPLRFVWWTSAIPFSIMIYIYDEMRKGVIRNHRKNFETTHPDAKYEGCWLTHNTFW